MNDGSRLHQQEPMPEALRRSIVAATMMPVGASLGFACATLIAFALAPVPEGTTVLDSSRLPDALRAAWPFGAILGALYLPAAFMMLAPVTNVRNAVIVAFFTALVFGVVGDAGVLFAPPWISASLGFWAAVIGIQQYARRRGNGGMGSYYR